jgi:dUTP pyrophosphatase
MELLDLFQNLKDLQNKLETNDNVEIDIDKMLADAGLDLVELEEKMMKPDSRLILNYTKKDDYTQTPYYNYETDSGFDLYSIEDVIIPSFGRALIGTGLSFDIGDGYEIQVRSKSGLALNEGLFVLNSPGTVDNGYTGEIKVIVFNTNPNEYKISKGMKIAQAVVSPVINGKWVRLEEVDIIQDKDRNSNGFGSTGI